MATKRAQKEYGTVGEIGTNVPVVTEEREEDLLEHIYARWRGGESMRPIDIAEENHMKTREFNQFIRRMVAHGYLYEPEEKQDLELTDFGKAQGAECVSRHRVITQFIQTVSGQNEQQAAEEACRMEHVVSRETVRGISGFLQHGDTYDRIYENTDLCRVSAFSDGTYHVCIGLYYLDRRCPRIIAAEYDSLSDIAELIVENGSSRFALHTKADDETRVIWYIKNGDWEKAEPENGAWVLPTRLFKIERSAGAPITEATLTIALTDRNQTPIVLDCRELDIHIW